MANKLKFSNARVMEEVQKYDCLYNKYTKEFKDRNKKDNAWKEVASRFEDLTPSEATKRFKNIRSSYTRFLKEKKKTPSGSGRDAVPKQFENLEWLSTYIEHRATWSNLKTKKKGENDTFSDSEDEESQSVVDTGNNELQHDESGQGIYSESENGPGDGGLSSQQDSDMYVDMAIMDPADFKQGSSSSSALALDHGHKDQSEKTRKRKNTDNVQSSSTNVKKSRSWAVYNKYLSKEEVDKALIKTANSISEQLKRENQQGDWGEKEVNDEDILFFAVLSQGLRQ